MEQVLNQEEDRCVWVGSSDGQFTIKSAWNMSRAKRISVVGFAQYVWHHCVPLKWSFLTWRAFQNCLPLDVNSKSLSPGIKVQMPL